MQILEHLSAMDGLVVVAYMIGMVVLGLAFRNQSSVAEFLLADRGMGWLPVGLSVMATLFSANSFLFYPGETYRYGLFVSFVLVSTVASAPLVLRWFIPMYVGSGCFTAYEILERRFDVRVRLMAAALFILLRTGWMAAATFSCSLAVALISGTNLYLTIIVMGVVTTVYTVVGGMKAVMWTDVAQFAIFTVAIVGATAVAVAGVPGGWSGMWQSYEAAGKLHFTDFRLDWSLRMGTWALLIGQFVETLSAYATDQAMVQRYLSAASLRTCRQAFLVNIAGVLLVVPGLLLLGVALAGFYRANPERLIPGPAEYFARRPADMDKVPDLVGALAQRGQASVEQWRSTVARDPRQLSEQLAAHYREQPERAGQDLCQVNRHDEVMPVFVRHEMPRGLIGLVVAALLAATMSSISGGVQSISTSVITDVRNRLFRPGGGSDPAADLRFVRTLTFVLGLAITGLACVVDRLGPIFDMTKKLNGAFSGPLLAVFVLGLFFRRGRALPVLAGAIAGTAFATWLTYATRIAPPWFCVSGFVTAWAVGYLGSTRRRSGRVP
jgi:sodium-dependent multivitamin transporter 6